MDLSLPLVARAAAKPAADAATDAAAVEAAADAATDAEPTATLRDCLSAYFAPEELRGDECYCCERCQRACARASSDETAPTRPPGGSQGGQPLLRTPERRPGSLEARRGLRSPPQLAPKAEDFSLSTTRCDCQKTFRLLHLPPLLVLHLV